MARKSSFGCGSIYFDKSKNKWIVQRYVVNYATGKSKPQKKSFPSEEEARKYLDSLMYQKENPIYIKNNGIPINELMKANLQKKYDANLLGKSQHLRVTKTIEKIEQSYIAKKI